MPTDHFHRYADHSAVVGLASSTSRQLRAWVAASWLARLAATLATGFDAATRTSTITEAFRTCARYVRHSYLYRWLTKEPEPDVIVIDLRETYAVGPVIALLDRLAPTLERTWRGSLAHRLTKALRTSSKLDWIAGSRTVQLLAAALEPPEPPEEACEASSDEGEC